MVVHWAVLKDATTADLMASLMVVLMDNSTAALMAVSSVLKRVG